MAGFYNMTYYGHAWNWCSITAAAVMAIIFLIMPLHFRKNITAALRRILFWKKPWTAAPDKNFKARCLFAMAKCSQKLVHQPQYSEFNTNWDKYDAAQAVILSCSKTTSIFHSWRKEYATTAFTRKHITAATTWGWLARKWMFRRFG